MAFTEKELDIARQIAKQGGNKEDFLNILQQIRQKQQTISQESEKPEEEIQPVEQISTPVSQQEDVLTLDKLQGIVKERQSEASEAEEGLKGFISETGEALGERVENVKDIIDRLKTKRTEASTRVQQIAKEEGLGAALVQSAKEQANKFGSSFQIAGQIAGGIGDIIFEGIENTIQEMTTENAEQFIEGTIANIADSETVQKIGEAYSGFRERNPELARNIEATVNIGQFIPITKAGHVATKPISKTAQQAAKKTAEQSVKDLSRGLLNIPGKLKPAQELDLGKYFAKNVKPTNNFDDIAEQFAKKGTDAISTVDNSLKSVTKTYKPQGAKEVLEVINENLKNIPFSTSQKKTVTDLLKKFNKEGLTLSELNKIKRSINDYTRAWTNAGKEAAGLAPESMRTKYSEIMKFIENTAKRESLPDIRSLNQDWVKSNELFELLSKQATSIGKKKGVQALQKTGIVRRLGSKIRQLREDLGLSDLPGAQGLEDIDLTKALETLKKAAEASEKKGIIERIGSIGKKGSGKGLDKVSPTVSAVNQTTRKAKDVFDIQEIKPFVLGEGSDRVVYDIGNNQVLKIAKNKRGIDQNLNALNIKLQDAGIIPKVTEVGKDFVIMEKVKPFQQLTKAEKAKVNSLVKDIDDLVKKEAGLDEVKKTLDKYGWREISKLDHNTFGWGDIKPKNIGIKNGKLVLLDEGTINLNSTLSKYKRQVLLAPVKVGAIAALVQELDADTLYEIFGKLFGGDKLKSNSKKENERIIKDLTPRG